MDVWQSVIAVAGTLLGSLLGSGVQARIARVARREERTAGRRADAMTAVTALVSALADHRRAMFVLEDLRLSTATPEATEAARTTSHGTRSAITTPLVTVRMLTPALANAAEAATSAAYAMRLAPDHAELETRRAAALAASNQLVDAAGELFADLDVTQRNRGLRGWLRRPTTGPRSR